MTEDTGQKPGAKKGRGGRPRAAPGELRGPGVGVRLNDPEREIIEAKAAAVGLTPAEFLRAVGLDYEVPRAVPEVNREVYEELARMAANLNRIVTLINSGQDVGIGENIALEMLESVHALRRELVGVSEQKKGRVYSQK